jgi:NAD-dependent dihydropyrimidine dehydrogenase PreA subunit
MSSKLYIWLINNNNSRILFVLINYIGGYYMGYDVIVDQDKCEGCEECVEVCPVDVYEMQDGKSVPVNAEECLGCESCVEVCDQEAITINEN